MKWQKVITTLCLFGMTGAASAAGLHSGLPGEFDNFSVSLCNARNAHCYLLHAKHASGTALKELLALEEPTVQSVRNGASAKAETWPQGYVDLELNRIVVWRNEQGHRQEKVFEL